MVEKKWYSLQEFGLGKTVKPSQYSVGVYVPLTYDENRFPNGKFKGILENADTFLKEDRIGKDIIEEFTFSKKIKSETPVVNKNILTTKSRYLLTKPDSYESY